VTPAIVRGRSNDDIATRERQWNEEVTRQLPDLLTQLLSSPIYGLGKDRDLPPAAYGVYLFSEKGKPRSSGKELPPQEIAAR
jgi:hypothetical protein